MSVRPVVVGVKPGQHPAIIEYALDEARKLGTSVRAVHVLQEPDVSASLAVEVAELVVSSSPLAAFDLVAVAGDVVDVLVDESHTAALVVVGADEVPWLARSSGAEIAHCVAMTATAPVVVVPRTELAARRARTVVVAVDGDADIDAPLTFAFATALRRREDLEIVYGAGAMSDYPGRTVHLARLENRVDAWRARFPDVEARVYVEGGHPVHACLDASLHASVLIVGQPVGPHPRLLTRSFASRVLRDATAPVVVVPLDHDRSPVTI